jgi:hypothetical protein
VPVPVKYPKIKFQRVGQKKLLDHDDFLRAIGKDPADEPVDRPKVISIKRAIEISGGNLSRTTIWRMTRESEQVTAA